MPHNKTFLSSVNTERERLTPKKIELSVIGDARDISQASLNFRENAENYIDDFADDVGTLMGTTDILVSRIDDFVEKMNDAERELNVVRGYTKAVMENQNEAVSLQKEIEAADIDQEDVSSPSSLEAPPEDAEKEIEDMLSKLEKSADDLGIDAGDIDIYKDLIAESNKIERLIDYSAKRLDEGRQVVDNLLEVSSKVNKISSIQ